MKKLLSFVALGVSLGVSFAVFMEAMEWSKTRQADAESNTMTLAGYRYSKTGKEKMLKQIIDEHDQEALAREVEKGTNFNVIIHIGHELRQHIMSVTSQENIKEVTLLQYAVIMASSGEMLQLLIDGGADVNANDPKGQCWTALRLAIVMNNQVAQRILTENGAITIKCIPAQR